MNCHLKSSLGVLLIAGSSHFSAWAQESFTLPTLPYGYDALEPHIDRETMLIHHTKHHQGYVNNLNTAMKAREGATPAVEDLCKSASSQPAAVRNNAGGHYNHSLFWTILTPKAQTQPSPRLLNAIEKQFGSMDSLKRTLNRAAAQQFGSGWAWLSVDQNKKLFVSSTPNQDNPLMDVVEQRGIPLMGIDVWEHAYYLKYQNKRGDYLSAIWNVVNWEEVSNRFDRYVPKGPFEDWPELLDFHEVMSQTFHPSEEGNFEPIRQRSGEMAAKAKLLAQSTIPAAHNNSAVKKAIKQLASGSQALHKSVQANKPDATIAKELNALHDQFHTIVGLCRADDHH